jgi:hypothetical protein
MDSPPVRHAGFRTPGWLALRHFGRHCLLGQLLLQGSLWLFAYAFWMRVPSPGEDTAGLKVMTLVYSVGAGLGLGVPAAVAGLVRIPLMSVLFARAQACPASWPIARLMGWTALIFMAPVVGLIGLSATRVALGLDQSSLILGTPYHIFVLVSVPWLLGSLLATFTLRHKIWLSSARKPTVVID